MSNEEHKPKLCNSPVLKVWLQRIGYFIFVVGNITGNNEVNG
jgi:hypothetical protein